MHPRSAGMPIALNVSKAENIQPSLQVIEKITTLEISLNIQDTVPHKYPPLVALPTITTPTMWRTRMLIMHSTITLIIIVSMD